MAAERDFNCWNCDSFQADDPATVKTGECRRNDPDQMWNNTGQVLVTGWPAIADGEATWCSEWAKTSRVVPAVP